MPKKLFYDHLEVEKKWQNKWEEDKAFVVSEALSVPVKKRFYCLDMFPYPSAEGLHVGHPEGYTATDIYSRYLRTKGQTVLHPMGWDAFGLPAENFAIKKGIHPRESTKNNIVNFKKQIKSFGFSYDWSREINTSSPEYYRWTQWLFLKLYKAGLAYQAEAPVNWCASCQTVLANEQVIDGRCERCKNEVSRKNLKQWFFKITDYADELLDSLASLDWPEAIKTQQRNWLGRSVGAKIAFKIKSSPAIISIFTTRPETLYGATYLVLSPEHHLLPDLKKHISNWSIVEQYQQTTAKKTEIERTSEAKEKTGVELKGVKAINPASGQEMPIWVADYVLAHYGTGAIMAVPAHDDRDYAFAKKFELPMREVIAGGNINKGAYLDAGKLINSGEFTGLKSEDVKVKIVKSVSGEMTTSYKLRDWLISRQRYWGAPIPIVYCKRCGPLAVPENDLPVLLPDDVDFRPTGESPLAHSASFHNINCPQCGEKEGVRREADTMDTFVCSSWYFLRFADPHNKIEPFSKEKIKYWLPIKMYVGGAEHAVLHLLYARFFTKFLADKKIISFREPFLSLRNQGMILGSDNEKMSKSRGNVVNPDDIVRRYGADAMRLYEMFMGPFPDAKPWSETGIVGLRRFLEKIYDYFLSYIDYQKKYSAGLPNRSVSSAEAIKFHLHQTISKVTSDIEDFRFNTAISSLMIFFNEIKEMSLATDNSSNFSTAGDYPSREDLKIFLQLLAPFAPHITEELWCRLGESVSIHLAVWPKVEKKYLVKKEVTIVVQVGGRVRANLNLPAGIKEEDVLARAKQNQLVQKYLNNQKIKRIIFIKDKLINIVL